MIVRFLYTIVLLILSPILIFGLYRRRPGKPSIGSRWREHFGLTPPLDGVEAPIWIHSVSVGEVMATKLLLPALHARYPDKKIVITTTTTTGAAQVEALDLAYVVHRYMPFDFPWAIKGFLRAVKPSLFLSFETEIWPNTLCAVQKAGVPALLINARLSEKSLRNYRKLSWLMRPALQCFDKIVAIHQDDAMRFVALGCDERCVEVSGSIKYDLQLSLNVEEQGQALRRFFGKTRPVWIVASTHEGEEETVLASFQQIKQALPDALMVWVPRHPERFNVVAELSSDAGFTVQRRTEHVKHAHIRESAELENQLDSAVDIYLGDTMGEMLLMLASADIVFMGGSLLGKKVGGHNFIEPALLGKVSVTGPSFYNFADLSQQLFTVDGLRVAGTADKIAESIVLQLADKEDLVSRGALARETVKQNQGAIERLNSVIYSLLKTQQER
uniref:lipid IV(A) 3-deoxy-D-manno-octulosonic acid transferase n=1 Tax=Thaumasiovibrio subtropicus TaxID=1891207 RepID=UPI000B353EAB|nr:lipid IV(A) 3-deoxy-D-manno-octulosonic acid transferase [Thaumasiovibrio subtropicus]